jgi:hypothetical protein
MKQGSLLPWLQYRYSSVLVALAMFGLPLPFRRWLGFLGVVSAACILVGTLEPAGFEPTSLNWYLVCVTYKSRGLYELGWGKGRRGVTMSPLRSYAEQNSPEGLRVEEGVRRRFRKSEGVRT